VQRAWRAVRDLGVRQGTLAVQRGWNVRSQWEHEHQGGLHHRGEHARNRVRDRGRGVRHCQLPVRTLGRRLEPATHAGTRGQLLDLLVRRRRWRRERRHPGGRTERTVRPATGSQRHRRVGVGLLAVLRIRVCRLAGRIRRNKFPRRSRSHGPDAATRQAVRGQPAGSLRAGVLQALPDTRREESGDRRSAVQQAHQLLR